MPLLKVIFNVYRCCREIGAVYAAAIKKSMKALDMSRIKSDMEKPYCDDLEGVLVFSDFSEAEKTIRTIEKLCRKYRKASDKKGVEYCRRIALLGRNRAGQISRNRKVSLQKRLEKREIAEWFRIWLETPSIFEDWIAMRKQTDEFKKLL